MAEAAKRVEDYNKYAESLTSKTDIEEAEIEASNLATEYDVLKEAHEAAKADYDNKVAEKKARDEEQAFNE